MNEQQIRLFGLQESVVRERLADILVRDDVSVTLFAEQEDICLHLTAKKADALAGAVEQIGQRLGAYVYSTDGASLERRAVTLLKEKGKTVAVAESCTGGLLASRLTNVPGCSAVFGTGIVSYSYDCKKRLLGVSESTLETYGAVSDQTAREMADGIRRQSGADVGVSITGEAGPQAAEAKPVGTVYVALADAKRTWVKELHLDALTMDREAMRRAAAFYALDLLYRYVQAYPTVIAGGERHQDYRQRQQQQRQKDETVKKHRFMAAVLPWHGSRKKRLIKFAVWMLVLLLLISGVFTIYNRVFSPDNNRELQDGLADVYWNDVSDLTVDSSPSDAYPIGMRSQFRGLYDINRDIGGWVRIPETQVNYPVMVYRDGYYSNHNFNDQFSVYGQPFFYETETTDELSDARVLTIYGNNTHDEQMFSSLLSYRRVAYLREHPIIEMNTVYTTDRWEIFAVMVVDERERASTFEYVRKNFDEDTAYDEYIAQLQRRSLFDSNVTINAQEDILLLVTNAEKEYHFSGAQLVVAARRLDNNAQATATYAINYQAIMPQAAVRSTTAKAVTKTTLVATQTTTATTAVNPPQTTHTEPLITASTRSDTVTTTESMYSSTVDVIATTVRSGGPSATVSEVTTRTAENTTTVTTQKVTSTTAGSTTLSRQTTGTSSLEPLGGKAEDTEKKSHDYFGN